MEQIIPPYSSNPHIDRIVDVFVRWQEEVQRQYPMVMRGSRTIKDFRNYLRSELETYSDNTISLLAKDVALYEALGKNMSLVLYQHLAELGGYSSLERMEQGLVTRIT
jgi:predicted  nucleic acid-binding Zn ribbon protein